MPRLTPFQRRSLDRWRQYALAGLALIVAVVLAYNEWLAAPEINSGLPRVPFGWVFWLTLTLAVVTFADKIVSIEGEKSALERETARTRVNNVLAALIVELWEETEVNPKHLGVSVFTSRGSSASLRLARVVRYRISNDPQATKVSWRSNKGAVGTCWSTHNAIHRDWHKQLKQWKPDLTEGDYASIPRADRDGFTYQEFQRIGGKYSEVMAFPVLSEGGAMLGVISVDIAAKAGLSTRVLTDHLEGIVAATCNMIAEDIAMLDELE